MDPLPATSGTCNPRPIRRRRVIRRQAHWDEATREAFRRWVSRDGAKAVAFSVGIVRATAYRIVHGAVPTPCVAEVIRLRLSHLLLQRSE